MPHKLPDHLLQWIYRVLKPQYNNVVLTYQDISIVLMIYPNFKVKTDIYISEQGVQQLLIKLYDTSYSCISDSSSNTKTLSIDIWIPYQYPILPPTIYVSKTDSNLQISPNNYFNNDGKFYHPFLTQWSSLYANDKSNNNIRPSDNRLLKLIEVFLNVVSNYPPIRVKPIVSESLPKLPPKPSIKEATKLEKPVQKLTYINLLKEEEVSEVENEKEKKRKALAPPLPPNPNRIQLITIIKDNLSTISTQTLPVELPLLDLQTLQNSLIKVTETELNHSNYLNYLSRTLEQNNMILNKATIEIGSLNEKLDDYISSNLTNSTFNHELVIAPTAVFNQLYHLCAKDCSLTDTIYCLESLHNKNKITTPVYLKAVRILARQQGEVKLHITKLVNICKLTK